MTKVLGRHRLQFIKQVATNAGANSYAALKRLVYDRSGWKAGNQSIV